MTCGLSILAVVCCLAPAPAWVQVADGSILLAAPAPSHVPLPPQPIRAAISKRPALLLPMYVSLGALQGLDYVSTTRAIASGAGREANPVMRPVVGNRAAFIAVKAGATAGTVWIAERMRRKHPMRAIVFMVATNAAMAAIVAHNYSVR